MKHITNSHLKTHNITTKEFIEQYPNNMIFCEKTLQNKILNSDKGRKIAIFSIKEKYLENKKLYELSPNYCKYCKRMIDYAHRNNKFCNQSCSAKFNNLKRIELGYEVSDEHKNKIKLAFEKIYPKKKKICKACGQIECIDKNICINVLKYKFLVKHFGFDENAIGSTKIYDEYKKIYNNLYTDYITNKMSSTELSKKYNFYNFKNITGFLKKLGIKIRNLSEANKLALKTGRSNIPQTLNGQYKSGYHISWENKTFFYRSGYELEYCKYLDNQKIKYEMESFRLPYFDTQKQKERIAIPDFYLPETNTIVEIKSKWTYDEQNMKDKVLSYKSRGYNFKLLLDKKEIFL